MRQNQRDEQIVCMSTQTQLLISSKVTACCLLHSILTWSSVKGPFSSDLFRLTVVDEYVTLIEVTDCCLGMFAGAEMHRFDFGLVDLMPCVLILFDLPLNLKGLGTSPSFGCQPKRGTDTARQEYRLNI